MTALSRSRSPSRCLDFGALLLGFSADGAIRPANVASETQNAAPKWLTAEDNPPALGTQTHTQRYTPTQGHTSFGLIGANNRRFIVPRRILWHCEMCKFALKYIRAAEKLCVGSACKCAILLPQIIIDSLTSPCRWLHCYFPRPIYSDFLGSLESLTLRASKLKLYYLYSQKYSRYVGC